MTQGATTIAYASPQKALCLLCHQRPSWKKPLYGHPVCKKCYYKFANRRQLAYIVDSLLFAMVVFPVSLFLIEPMLVGVATSEVVLEMIVTALAVVFTTVFAMKDGFNGQSPGRWLTGVQVVDDATGRPISFGQSFKRNAIFLLGTIPFVGTFASLIIVIVIAIQLNKGYRIGDRFAQTRVIWKRYARSSVFGGDDLLCHSCGYDLTANESGVCPECGTPRETSDEPSYATQ